VFHLRKLPFIQGEIFDNLQGLHYNQSVDWWSFGVLLYEMLIGQSPFSGCDEDELFWSICNEIPWYPHYLSKEALKCLQSLLEKDVTIRLGSMGSIDGDVKYHPFFSDINWERLERREVEPPFKPQVVSWFACLGVDEEIEVRILGLWFQF
jgi:serine/threonine protein kinase